MFEGLPLDLVLEQQRQIHLFGSHHRFQAVVDGSLVGHLGLKQFDQFIRRSITPHFECDVDCHFFVKRHELLNREVYVRVIQWVQKLEFSWMLWAYCLNSEGHKILESELCWKLVIVVEQVWKTTNQWRKNLLSTEVQSSYASQHRTYESFLDWIIASSWSVIKINSE